MTVIVGNGGSVKSGSSVVGEVTDWSYDEKDAIITKPHAIGDTVESYLPEGVKGGSGTINVVYDPADTPGQGSLTAGSSVTLTLEDDSAAPVGTKFHTGTVFIASVGKKSAAGSLVSRSYAFSGVLTESTH